jgi:hypothetical protein
VAIVNQKFDLAAATWLAAWVVLQNISEPVAPPDYT